VKQRVVAWWHKQTGGKPAKPWVYVVMAGCVLLALPFFIAVWYQEGFGAVVAAGGVTLLLTWLVTAAYEAEKRAESERKR